jgi:hypothetical protein
MVGQLKIIYTSGRQASRGKPANAGAHKFRMITPPHDGSGKQFQIPRQRL